MITETNIVSEINEHPAMTAMQSADEIKRNHIQTTSVQPLANDRSANAFTIKYNRLKKSLRKRSGGIF
jgi:hypothetical protein